MPKIKKFYNILFYSLIFSILLTSCGETPPIPPYNTTKSEVADSAMIVSPHPLATEVGLEILKAGGNAIDAIVGVQFALAVVYPRAGNLGGGGFLVLRDKDGKINSLDYREKAPLKADRNMYLDNLGNVVGNLSIKGHLAAGVPGSVAGLLEAHAQYGTIDFKDLIQPAIDLAENGFGITDTEAKRLNRFMKDFKTYNDPTTCPFIKNEWFVGDILIQKDLAETLKLIRDKGKDGFYEGKTADLIVEEMSEGKGLISKEDLSQYKPVWREPITVDYKNYKMISMPPPSSGGIVLGQLLVMTESYPLKDYGFHHPRSIHLMTEVERRAFADRAEHLGDSDFYPVPVKELLEPNYLYEKMNSFTLDSATASTTIAAGDFILQKESFETTHTSVVDKWGNAAALTTTLNSNYGCKVMVDGAGFFLNNEMDDFSAKPGVPNQFGLLGAEANAIMPEKRMLSSMTPTIFEKDGELFMVLGAPGGSTIITAVFQVFINVVEFGMPLDQAVQAKRFHHQWLPDQILIEKGTISDSTKIALKNLGHSFKEIERMAVVKAIMIGEDGKLYGAGDPRNPDDDARGY